MKLNMERVKTALDKIKNNPEPRQEKSYWEKVDDWADEWWSNLARECGGDPWEKWDGEADEIERKSIEK